MTHRRNLLAFAAVLLVAGCSLLPVTPGPRPTAPAAGDLAPRRAVDGGNGWVTFMPASPRGAVLGIDYAYTMPMCGTLGPIDVDGSFWDSTPGDGTLDGQPGVFRLITPWDAVFNASDGSSVDLRRHDGPKSFPICS